MWSRGGRCFTFSGGSTLELRGLTVAPSATFVDGNFWQRALLSAGWDVPGWGGFPGSRSRPPRMGLWFRASRMEPLCSSVAVWQDRHGCRIRLSRIPAEFGSPEWVSNEFELARLSRGWRPSPQLTRTARGLGVAWKVQPEETRPEYGGPSLHLTLQLTAASRAGCQVTLIRATDERGRSVLREALSAGFSRNEIGGGYSPPRTVAGSDPQPMSLSLSVPVSTRRLNLEFALHRTPEVEFLVKS